MIDTRNTMKRKYNHYSCPHCREGISDTVCEAYREMRQEMGPEGNLQDKAIYLRCVIARRKEVESQDIPGKTFVYPFSIILI